MVSASPHRLHIYDPKTESDMVVGLPLSPSAVSVSPDGLYAAVAHNAWVSYISLTSAKLEKTITISIDASDVVLAGNGYVYSFPRSRGKISSVDLDTEVEAPGGGGGANAIFKLHPGGQSVYWANRGSSPSDIGKHPFTDGVIAGGYDSRYHGDYPMCGDLWMSKDGLRIFTACGNVFRASEIRDQDMIYNGSLREVNRIQYLDHSESTGQVVVIPGQPENDQIQTYSYEFLTFEQTVRVPEFRVGDRTFPGHARYVFFSQDGSRYMAVVQADQSSGMLNDFAVVTYDADRSPQPTPVAASPSETQGPISLLDYRVVDAEYSKPLNRIVSISGNPDRLNIYDPVTRTDTVVALSLTPNAVSIGPKGLFAAVGHDGWISYVDLTSGTLVKTFPVSTDVIDVVLAGNGFVYAFPRRDQWEYIRSVEISTESESPKAQSKAIRAGTLAKLHPGGLAMYGANNGLSPDDIERYTFADGPAVVSYDSRYHGDHRMCGNLWISEDGKRIFTACGNVFRASDIRDEDMSYNGALESVERIEHLDHSGSTGLVALIPKGGMDTEIQMHNYEFLGFEESVDLPNFTVGGKSYPSHGRFVFFNKDSSAYHVIIQADAKASYIADYGVVTFTP